MVFQCQKTLGVNQLRDELTLFVCASHFYATVINRFRHGYTSKEIPKNQHNYFHTHYLKKSKQTNTSIRKMQDTLFQVLPIYITNLELSWIILQSQLPRKEYSIELVNNNIYKKLKQEKKMIRSISGHSRPQTQYLCKRSRRSDNNIVHSRRK